MPDVTINTYANLRQYTAGQPTIHREICVGMTVQQLLEQLQFPLDEVRIILVDNRAATLDRALEGGEQIDLFSAVGGG